MSIEKKNLFLDVCGQEGHFNLVKPLPLIVADTDIEEADVSPDHRRQDGRQERFDGRQDRFEGRQRARRRKLVKTIIKKWTEHQIKKNLFVKKFGSGCRRSLEVAELKVLDFITELI